jgi:hypothetical protein
MRRFSFQSCFSFSLIDLSDKVYIRLLGGGDVSGVVVIVFVVLIFLGP